MKSKKHKIAFLSHLDSNLYRFRLPIMKELVNKDWQVYAITPKGKHSHKFLKHGITHISYWLSRRSLNPLLELRTLVELYRILKHLKPTVLHTFVVKPNIYGTIVGKLTKIPVIINSVTGLGSFYIENSLKAKIIRFLLNFLYKLNFCLSDCTVFQNFDDFRYFKRRTICKKSRLTVIKGSGINTTEFSPQSVNAEVIRQIRKDLSLEGKTIVLMVARLLKHKGIMEYCQAARMIMRKPKYENKIEFLLAGDFDTGNPYSFDENNLNYFINSKFIRFLGWRNDIKELTALCHIFVLPSYREGIPRTLIEAASMGKPLITANSVGCREVVEHGKNGYLVPKKNHVALGKAIESLIHDRDAQKKYGEYSRSKAIKEFDIKIVLEKTIKLYGQLTKKILNSV